MHSKPWKEFDDCRQRIAETRLNRRLMAPTPKARRFCTFRDGHFFTGTQSTHRSRTARLWRTLLRIKSRLHRDD